MKLNVGRIIALADGIFAIAMTLLAVTIDLPKKSQELSVEGLHKFLIGQFQEIFNFALSFILLALFWVIHHHQFHHITHTDKKHLWINMFIFMSVTLVPFSTSIAGDFPADWMAQVYFHINMFVMGVLFYLNWAYATKNKRLVEENLSESEIAIEKKQLLVTPFVAFIAFLVAFANPHISVYLYILVPIILSLKRFNFRENHT
ncbi:MAG: TMEM175 family protein [Candidatus Omnitrophica bacterium]|nr:TMEM175 family protein [Candidatus Omnitrophota bacterium]